MRFQKVKTFAKDIDCSERTTRGLLKQGLPHIRLDSGTILIDVERAVPWLRKFSVNALADETIDNLLEGLR
nr:hypothetical protein 8 [Desulfobulbaceae bacterium]